MGRIHPNLVLWMPMAAGPADVSGNSQTITTTGTVPFSAADGFRAAEFVGDGSSFNAPPLFPTGGAAYTVSVWARQRSVKTTPGSGGRMAIFRCNGPSWSPGLWHSSDILRPHASVSGSSGVYYDYTWPNDLGWHHYLYVFDPTGSPKIVLYIDGVPKSHFYTTTYTAASTGGAIYIGSQDLASAQYSYDGWLRDFRVYESALSDGDCRRIYHGLQPIRRY